MFHTDCLSILDHSYNCWEPHTVHFLGHTLESTLPHHSSLHSSHLHTHNFHFDCKCLHQDCMSTHSCNLHALMTLLLSCYVSVHYVLYSWFLALCTLANTLFHHFHHMCSGPTYHLLPHSTNCSLLYSSILYTPRTRTT